MTHFALPGRRSGANERNTGRSSGRRRLSGNPGSSPPCDAGYPGCVGEECHCAGFFMGGFPRTVAIRGLSDPLLLEHAESLGLDPEGGVELAAEHARRKHPLILGRLACRWRQNDARFCLNLSPSCHQESADRDFTRGSPNDLSRPSIPVRPVWTRRALLSDRVVDAFFVWASDDPRTYHDRLHMMGRHEVKRGAADILVESLICLGRMPALQR